MILVPSWIIWLHGRVRTFHDALVARWCLSHVLFDFLHERALRHLTCDLDLSLGLGATEIRPSLWFMLHSIRFFIKNTRGFCWVQGLTYVPRVYSSIALVLGIPIAAFVLCPCDFSTENPLPQKHWLHPESTVKVLFLFCLRLLFFPIAGIARVSVDNRWVRFIMIMRFYGCKCFACHNLSLCF